MLFRNFIKVRPWQYYRRYNSLKCVKALALVVLSHVIVGLSKSSLIGLGSLSPEVISYFFYYSKMFKENQTKQWY